MSYNQLGSGGDQPMLEEDIPHKIRRVTKACDLCRKRKARCDGDPSSNRACTLCTNTGVACVFTRFARKRGHESSQARELETQIIELEGIIRLIAPGIDIEQELDESANSDSPGGSSTLLRPSDSAFLHASDAFVRPSTDSASAFFHPSSAMFNYQTHEEETKPDLSTLSSSSVPLSPIRSTPGSTFMYSPPGTSVEHSTPSLGSNNPYGIVTPPGATTTPYGSGPSKDPRGVGPEGRPTTSRSPYHTEL